MTDDSRPADAPRGLLFALAAYGVWGFLPLYMKALDHIPAPEIIAHRVVWSLPVAAGVLLWQRRASDVGAAIRRPRLFAMAGLTAALISANWLIYVWAVTRGFAIEAALGYYINPLFSVLLAAAVLGERLGRMQLAAIGLAALAVAVLTLSAGGLPLIALGLTFSWGFYAFFKRSLPLGPNQGFTLEVLILLLPALAYILWLEASGRGHFLGSATDALLLIGCGPLTAVPLLFYANAAKLVRLSTMGIMQYMTPTMVFIIAVTLFAEPFTPAQRVAFPLIWAAVALYSAALLRSARARHKAATLPAALRKD